MDNDLFTYEVKIANIPCNSKMDDDSEHEADDDMGYDTSDVIRGDDEVELTDEESSDDEDEIAKIFRIDTNIFDYETPLLRLEICALQMGMYISSQSSCDFTTITIIGESEDEGTTEGIIRNYYDREDGETTLRFEV
ncbi:hypothetical protein Tco_1517650 [Tanacetum coccineum]